MVLIRGLVALSRGGDLSEAGLDVGLELLARARLLAAGLGFGAGREAEGGEGSEARDSEVAGGHHPYRCCGGGVGSRGFWMICDLGPGFSQPFEIEKL